MTTVTLLIKNGRLIDPANHTDTIVDILIRDGLIHAIGDCLTNAFMVSPGDTLDATGKVVAPGLVDMHVHLRDPGLTHKEDISSGTRAAASGGFTTIAAMPNTRPVCDNPATLRYVTGHPGAVVRLLSSASITVQSHGKELTDFQALREAGAAFLTDDGESVMDARVMRDAMRLAEELGIMLMVHEEDKNLAGAGVMHEGSVSKALGLAGVPSCAETAMAARDIVLATETGCHLHITHVSTKETVDLIRFARSCGVHVTSDVTPHSFSLTDEEVRHCGADAKMYPPLRSEADRQALIAGLIDGTIDAIATDHAPHAPQEKAQGIVLGPKGVVAMETAFGAAIEYLVKPRHLSLRDLVRLMSTAPASILKLGSKGIICGERADLVVLDTDIKWTVRSAEFKSKSRNTPFEGKLLAGKPVATIVGGVLRMRDGEIIE
jgi:dihydroorotase